jgi:Xaa-Pro dipeptidase
LWKAEGKFNDFINYNKLKSFMPIGGIRIEDNVLITEDGHRVLGKLIPKTVKEVEEVCS